MSKVISIVNQKGGVGKTTTAVNLSSYLSESNHKVLLIDLDSQGNAGSAVGLKKESITVNIYDIILGDCELKDALYPTPFDNLHIIPSTQDLAAAEIEIVNLKDREFILKNKMAPLRKFYDYIIIDCAPSLGLLTVNALAASDEVIIPVQCEYLALEGISQLIKTIELIKNNINPQLNIAGMVLTMFDTRTALNKLVVNNIKSYFNDLVFNTIIPRNIRLAEAPSHGLPIALYKANCKGSLSYKSLAKEVLTRV